VLEDKIVIMDNSTRIEGDDDTPLSAGIIDYLDFNANAIRSLGADWKAVMDNKVLEAVKTNSDYRFDDDRYAKMSAEVPVAFKYVRENIVEQQHRHAFDRVKMVPMYRENTASGQEVVLVHEDIDGDDIFDMKYIAEVKTRTVKTMEEHRSFNATFLVDDNYANLTPLELQTQLKYSLMCIGDRKNIIDDSFKEWKIQFEESAISQFCALLNGTQGGGNNFTTNDYRELVISSSGIKDFFISNGPDTGIFVYYNKDTGKFLYDINTKEIIY